MKLFQTLWKHNPAISGHLRVELRERGKLRTVREGHNIWTLTGRELVAELLGLKSNAVYTTADGNVPQGFRYDRIAFIGVGIGAQPEVGNIANLVDPVPYVTGEFLAALEVPATFPAASGSTTNTSIRFVREFSRGEISLGYSVVITECGLFTNGDPNNNWAVPAPTSVVAAASRAPAAYKLIEPVTKTTDSTLRFIWDVRIS
jgi:hypothetical protein